MATRFADRTIIKFNKTPIVHVQNGALTVDFARTPVQTMNKERRVPGFTEGNKTVSGSFLAAIEDRATQALLETIDYSIIDVEIEMEFGGEALTVTQVWLTSVAYNAANVGTEVTKNWEFGGVDVVNGSGSSITDVFATGAAAASAGNAILGLGS